MEPARDWACENRSRSRCTARISCAKGKLEGAVLEKAVIDPEVVRKN
jgi:hypothetical protein